MNQKRNKVFSALGALAATVILCLGVSCSQTTPTAPTRPPVAPVTSDVVLASKVIAAVNSSATFVARISPALYPAPSCAWEVFDVTSQTWIALLDENGVPATGLSYLWIGVTENDSGASVRAVITNIAGSAASKPCTLVVGTPPVAPAIGYELIYNLVGQQLKDVAITPSASYVVGNYALALPEGEKIKLNVKGTASAATSFKVMLVNNGPEGTAANDMLDAAVDVPVNADLSIDTTALSILLPITKNPTTAADTMSLVFTAASDVHLTNLAICEFWLVPTPPQEGAKLLYAANNIVMDFGIIGGGWQWTTKAWSSGADGGESPFDIGTAAPDTYSFEFHGQSGFAWPAGETVYFRLIDNTTTATPQWVGPVCDAFYLLDGSSAVPAGARIDIKAENTDKSATSLSSGCTSVGNMLMYMVSSSTDTSVAGRQLVCERIRFWRKHNN